MDIWAHICDNRVAFFLFMQHQYSERKEKPPKIDFSSSAYCCLKKLFSCSPKNLWHVDCVSVLFYWGTEKGLECHSRKITLDHLLLAWDFSPLPLHPLFSILSLTPLPHLPLLLTLSLSPSISFTVFSLSQVPCQHTCFPILKFIIVNKSNVLHLSPSHCCVQLHHIFCAL